ncbi:MAG: glycerol-3-phosphate dehydrogenase/oxidase [Actinomycetota bacterium]
MLGPTSRAENLERMARDTFDVVVIGGGITGAGCALDAAARGLSVALIEKDDFASGTSSRSSKMVHGGMRYMAQFDFGLTWEAAHERELLIRLAPHLVRRLKFLYPVYRKKEVRQTPIGLSLYKALAGFRGAKHARASAQTIRELAPSLDPAAVKGAWTFYDARADDARLVFEVARTAHNHGAVIANHARVTGFERTNGRISAATVTDSIGATQIEVRGRSFINATGIWAHDVAELDASGSLSPLRPAKGIHLFVSAARLDVRAAVIVPSGLRDGRSLFAVPWGPVVLLGTTDTDYTGPIDSPAVTHEDVDYVLNAINGKLQTGLTTHDVVAASAGLRPLVAGDGGRTADLSRHHAITVGPGGLTTVTGGKLTTYRRMAADAIDAVCKQLDVKAKSPTAKLPIGLTRPLADVLAETNRAATELSADPRLGIDLVRIYGDLAPRVLELAAQDRELALPLAEGMTTIRAQIAWAARHEMAQSVEDVLAHRTRMSLADRAGGTATAAPQIIAAELGWDAERTARDVSDYLAKLAAERGPVAPPTSARA